jgi:hypothetical protein
MFSLFIWVFDSFLVEIILYNISERMHQQFKTVFFFFGFWEEKWFYLISGLVRRKSVFDNQCFFSELMNQYISLVKNSIPDTMFVYFYTFDTIIPHTLEISLEE